MNKKYFSVLLMGALAVASVGTITSCKDYDDDISGLQTQIDQLSEAIKDIQAQIKNGAILTSVTPVADGIKITLNENGQSKDYTITNGKDGAAGKDGKSWQIGDNGNWWYNDGTGLKDSHLPSRGEQGEQGAPGAQGPAGERASRANLAHLANLVLRVSLVRTVLTMFLMPRPDSSTSIRMARRLSLQTSSSWAKAQSPQHGRRTFLLS